MSDCFDHESGAWDQHISMSFEGAGDEYPGRGFLCNPFHSWVEVDEIEAHPTRNGFNVMYGGVEYFVPRKILKRVEGHSMLVHRSTWSAIRRDPLDDFYVVEG